MTLECGARWYVVQTHARAEGKAVQHLGRQGFATYLPRYLKKRRHARKIEVAPTPFFPRYLFVAMDVTTQRWRAVQSTVGVAQLVRTGDQPASVADSLVAGIKAREDEAGFIRLGSPAERFARGDRIRVVDGVFSACCGLFEAMTDCERVAILLDLLGRKVRVVLDSDLVTAA